MSIDLILERLDKVRRSGKAYSARCPAHEDKTASLSLVQAEDRVLLHCFAGCAPAAVLSSIGLQLSDLYDKPLTPTAPLGRRTREELFASLSAISPGLHYDINVMRLGLDILLRTGSLPADAGNLATFLGASSRVMQALDTLQRRRIP